MTHTKSMDDSSGDFAQWVESGGEACPHCKSENVRCRLWESRDGAYEDYQYRCTDCGYTWWVDGIDS